MSLTMISESYPYYPKSKWDDDYEDEHCDYPVVKQSNIVKNALTKNENTNQPKPGTESSAEANKMRTDRFEKVGGVYPAVQHSNDLPLPSGKQIEQESARQNYPRIYRCPYCLIHSYSTGSELIQHLKSHRSLPPTEILKSRSPLKLSPIMDLKQRGKVGEKGQFQCEHCALSFKQSINLAAHMSMHDKRRPFKCSQCSYHFLTKGRLQLHETQFHNGKDATTNITAKYKEELLTKIQSCRVVLSRCDDAIAIAAELQSSKQITSDFIKDAERREVESQQSYNGRTDPTEKGNRKLHSCPSCSTCFTNLRNRDRHICSVHLKKPTHKCSVCSKEFVRLSVLKEHIRIHSGVRPYECQVCGRRFKQSSNLKPHMNMHTGNRPFECSICSKRFSRKDNLKHHMSVHTGQRRHKCTQCPRQFRSPVELRRHLVKVHQSEI